MRDDEEVSSPTPPAKLTAAQVAARRVAKASVTFGACMVAVLITSMLPLPWSLAGLAFAVATFTAGIRALRVVRAVPQAGSMQFLIMIGMAMTAFTTLALAGQAVLYPTYMTFQTCQAQAITETAAADCEAQFQKALTTQFPALAGLLQAP